MSTSVPQYAGVAGEISDKLIGRSDIEKYDLGVAEARNFFVDYQGGLSNRPGTELVDVVQTDWKPVKFFRFQFAPSALSTYVLVFGHQYVRFVQAGAYVLEGAKAITGITAAAPGVVTAVGHGYSDGDLVRIFDVVGMTEVNGQTFVIDVTDANHFKLKRLDEAVSDFDTSAYTPYVSGGNVYRVYTVASPYDADDLEELTAHQIRSTIRLSHPNYKQRILTRTSDTSWALALRALAEAIGQPANVVIIPDTAGTAGVAYAVTAVDKNGEESLMSPYGYNDLIVEFTVTQGTMTVVWDPVDGAVYYNVYRSQVLHAGAQLNRGMELGWVGRAYGPRFQDNNIIPDFTHTPPTHQDPFADGAVDFIEVLTGGTLYNSQDVVALVGGAPGSGFEGYLVIDPSTGEVVGVSVVNPGSGYTSVPTVSITTVGGSGATFLVHLTATGGNDPRVSTLFQQREVEAGMDENPLTIEGSKPGSYDNFDTSVIVSPSDAYSHELDSEQAAPILHLVPTRSGLVVMSKAGLWHLVGDGQNAVTATSAIAEEQSTKGADTTEPLVVDNDLLYLENRARTVRLLSYNDFTKVFAGQDLSILSNHLFPAGNKIIRWSYSPSDNLVYAVRQDGVLLELALVKEQNIYGWTRAVTNGRFLDTIVVQEDDEDGVYFLVNRYLDNRWAKVIERQRPRKFTSSEDAWFLDCALELPHTYPAANLVFDTAEAGDTLTLTADAAVFVSGDVDKIIRMCCGKFRVTAYTSAMSIDVEVINPAVQATGLEDFRVAEGDWTMDTKVNFVDGLWLYEGYTVDIVADGNVLAQQIVTNGRVTLAAAASSVLVGWFNKAWIKTLPPTSDKAVMEDKLKRPVAARIRMLDSRGLSVGKTVLDVAAPKERTNEPYGEPTRLQTGVFERLIPNTSFDRNGQFYIVQNAPLPATILSFVTNLDIGDADG